ncbi:Hsp20/alpha crystallin family protein [Sulfurovum sp. TSL1]|uniref:Hsp20/alpha crystallin family protein n=1 Tax=Sulfurovum sp. TSL1 TaxID=2826994 RepID=UPI001CC393D1|nr:Hsp20/alpha crystallin family protein [Sulfurovum sp. TSL1]GIT97833.1 heat-shock protein Hsp20 [Sulfurovum sp. TSL1]
MLLTKFDPMRDFRDLEERMASALNLPEIGSELSNVSGFSPSVNTREGDYAYHVEVDLPGVKKDDIHVDLKDNVLTISGERKNKKEVKEKDYYKKESSYGRFQRSFTLPDNTDAENIEANCKDGVLEVVIPKIERSKKETKKIKIK